MVIYNVNDHSQSTSVAFIDESLIFLACSIVLVESEPVVRIISPAEVTIEFLDRHELNSCHAKILNIVKLFHCTCDILTLREIAEKHLIDHKVVLILYLEILMLPSILRSIDLEGRDKRLCTLRECRHTVNILVIPLIVDNFRIWITDEGIGTRSIAETILETVFLVCIEAIQGNPPAELRTIPEHRTLSLALPAIPITDDVAILVACTGSILVIKNESDTTICIIIDTMLNSLRQSLGHDLIWCKFLSLILAVSNRAELIGIVALSITITSSYNKSNLCHWSLPSTEIFTDRRLHLELPMVFCNLCKMSLFLSCAPLCRNKLPLIIHNHTKVAIELTRIAIERI